MSSALSHTHSLQSENKNSFMLTLSLTPATHKEYTHANVQQSVKTVYD